MTKPKFSCISATCFSASGAFDPAAFTLHLQRIAAAGFDLYLGSGGSGEGHSLSPQELQQVYETGVAAGGGRVSVHAMLPEESSAAETRKQVDIAVRAGVDVLNIYQLEGRHGLKPTDRELQVYFDDVLADLGKPVALTLSATSGYLAKPEIVLDICRRHDRIGSIILMRATEAYLIELRRLMGDRLPIHVEFDTASLTGLALGVSGLCSSESNILPATTRKFLDLYEQRDLAALGQVYADMKRFRDYVRKWPPTSARWLKMCLKVLNLPGGEGGTRRPLLMAEQAELDRFAAGLIQLGLPEIDQLARRAGLNVPARTN